MKKETVIFLDIDGVLQHVNYRKYCMRKDWNYNWRLDPTNLALIKEIQDKYPEVRFVISSTWRINKIKSEIEHIFHQSGLDINLHDRWKTKHRVTPTVLDYTNYMMYTYPEMRLYHHYVDDCKEEFSSLSNTYNYRCWEILNWLQEQPIDTITEFIILDDSNDMLFLEQALVQVKNGEHLGGFKEEHQKLILDTLEGKSNHHLVFDKNKYEQAKLF